MVKSRLFRREYAKELFAIAQNDLEAARVLAQGRTVRPETTLLMVQQCIEKAFKAVLCHCGQSVPQTHDIEFLVDRLSQMEARVPEFISDTDFGDLTTFATLRRYEEGKTIITFDELQESLALADRIVAWAMTEIAS